MSTLFKDLDFSQRVENFETTPKRLMIGGTVLAAFSAYATIKLGDISLLKDFLKAILSQPFNSFNTGCLLMIDGGLSALIKRDNQSPTPPQA